MKIFIGADHAGYKLKEEIKKFLDSKSIAYDDLGNLVLDKQDDYPDFSDKVARAVAKNKSSLGILLCGSSQGACIVANKTKGVRAASARSVGEARLAREGAAVASYSAVPSGASFTNPASTSAMRSRASNSMTVGAGAQQVPNGGS